MSDPAPRFGSGSPTGSAPRFGWRSLPLPRGLPGSALRASLGALALASLLASLLGAPASAQQGAPGRVEVRLQVEPLTPAATACTDAFVAHPLAHTTTVPGGDRVRMFEANGGGVGIGDLDRDGDLDLVLANHAGASTLLWNEGALRFRAEPLGQGDARAVTLVDVDGDDRLDIVLGRRVSAPNWWRNEGGSFALESLPGVGRPLYAIDWADLDGDGDLDLVGASYDAALLTEFGQEFLQAGSGGVFVYRNDGGAFREVRLAGGAQGLALLLVDVTGDARPDILVGNDFAVPDMAWENPGSWEAAADWRSLTPFRATSHSTMSLDAGDLDNDGVLELFSTDMKPYPGEPPGPWAALMEAMADEPHPEGDPQVMENVLQVASADGSYRNEAVARGVDGTGWSWSGKFGDLDRDGFLDLYVVNGMIEATTFAHLPRHELLEENQAFRNDGRGGFRPMPHWALNATASGRGMGMADLDGDGDLDIVVNNLRSPAQLFENRLCGGSSVLVDLHWPGSANTRALGAVATLHSDRGTFRRDLRAGSGYLSGDPPRLHFGIPEGAVLHALEVRWPDGAVSVVEAPPAGALLQLTR